MASEVDICNLALSRLGDTANVASISPPEGSAQAEHCARFYPLARDVLLEMHPWHFATRRVTLAALAVDSWHWQYAYARPSDAIKLLAVLPPSATSDEQAQPYAAEASDSGGLILSNQQSANLLYIARVRDATVFSPRFVDALGWLLAAYLAGPVIKGDAGAAMASRCTQYFTLALGGAAASDANQRNSKPEHTPAWIGGR